MSPDLAELRRLLDAATPRPWSTVSGAGNVWHFPGDAPPTVVAGHQRAPRVPDAILIAAAVNALPALLDAAEERDALLAIIDDARHALAADGPKLEPARQVLARALPQLTAWQDRKRRDRDITPPHVIAHRGAQLDAVTAERDALRAERDALAAKVEDLECVLAGAGVCVECYANGWHKLDCSRRRTAHALDGTDR